MSSWGRQRATVPGNASNLSIKSENGTLSHHHWVGVKKLNISMCLGCTPEDSPSFHSLTDTHEMANLLRLNTATGNRSIDESGDLRWGMCRSSIFCEFCWGGKWTVKGRRDGLPAPHYVALYDYYSHFSMANLFDLVFPALQTGSHSRRTRKTVFGWWCARSAIKPTTSVRRPRFTGFICSGRYSIKYHKDTGRDFNVQWGDWSPPLPHPPIIDSSPCDWLSNTCLHTVPWPILPLICPINCGMQN